MLKHVTNQANILEHLEVKKLRRNCSTAA